MEPNCFSRGVSLKFLFLNFLLHTQNGYKCYTVFLYLCTRGITTVTSSVACVASAIKGADTGESSARDAREPSLASPRSRLFTGYFFGDLEAEIRVWTNTSRAKRRDRTSESLQDGVETPAGI